MDTTSEQATETAIVITEELTDRFHTRQVDAALDQYEKYREDNGSAQLRQSVLSISKRIDDELNILTNNGCLEVCEIFPGVYAWDFELIPELLNRVAASCENWLEASRADVRNGFDSIKNDCKDAQNEAQTTPGF